MTDALLLYGSSDPSSSHFSADLLWRTKLVVPDPFVYCEIAGKGHVLLSSLEFGRAKNLKGFTVHLLDDLFPKTGKRSLAAALDVFLKRYTVKTITVPFSLPYALGKTLENRFKLSVHRGSVFPERAKKSAEEVRAIGEMIRHTHVSMELAREVLAQSVIRGNHLYHESTLVTSEYLRNVIEANLFRSGGISEHAIVSCGMQAVNPHEMGSGPILPHQPIVLDVFPRSRSTGYYADVSRTLFKGSPSTALVRMYEVVMIAQTKAIQAAQCGTRVRDLEALVREEFAKQGYPTVTKNGRSEGFIHSLGHGVGLEVHEDPHVGENDAVLEEGNMITIEPGLYYPKARRHIPAGGIRIEDMVLITKEGGIAIQPTPTSLMWAVVP